MELREFDAKNDAYERDFYLLKKNLIAEAKSLGFAYDGYIDILEKAAADIIDLGEGEK
jgi:hypothetical protein